VDTSTAKPSFVRAEMIPQQAPPARETGAFKWVRENLLSSIPNALMTLVSLYVVYAVLAAVLPWIANGIWDAGSLTECREIRDARFGERSGGHGQGVACWAVLTDRWDQLTFGFYPSELYWRPILAVVLFFAAILPILYDTLPRKLLYLSAAAPFLCFWLLWGGTFWSPVLIAAGFVLGWLVLKGTARLAGNLAATVAAIVVPILYWLFAAGPLIGWLAATLTFWSPVLIAAGFVLGWLVLKGTARLVGNLAATVAAVVVSVLYWLFVAGPLIGWFAATLPLDIQAVQSREFGGFLLAFVIGASGIILSMPLGVILALGRQSDLFIVNKFSVLFIEVIRGVPLIVWLFTAQLLLGYFLPPGSNFDLMVRVIIMVTLFASAYIAEVIRGGMASLPRGQYEGADSLGLTYWQSMQFIVLPQALKVSIPGIVSSFIGLFKDTTLVVFIGLLDPIGFSNAIRADTDWNGIYWELFIFIGLCFFICCFGMSQYSQWLERKLATDHR